MNNQEIIEGIKLIAEFVDLEVLANPHLGGVRPKSSNSTPVELLKIIYSEITYEQESVYPQFHASWDWLMPVIAKIYEMEEYEDYKNEASDIFINGGINIKPCDIISTFNDVVKFIKWYNTL